MVEPGGDATEVAEPGDGTFDNPAAFVASQGATVLQFFLHAVAFVWGDLFDVLLSQSLAQRSTVVGFVGDSCNARLKVER